MYNCKEKQNSNNSGVPIGTIINFFGDTAPEGYLSCDGTEYLKSDYPSLSTHLASLTTANLYVGSDSDHFKVPDLRGEFLRGTGTNSHTKQGSGADVGEHQDATYQFKQRGAASSHQGGPYHIDKEPFLSLLATTDFQEKTTGTIKMAGSYQEVITQTGVDTEGYTTRPTNTSVLYCIKY